MWLAVYRNKKTILIVILSIYIVYISVFSPNQENVNRNLKDLPIRVNRAPPPLESRPKPPPPPVEHVQIADDDIAVHRHPSEAIAEADDEDTLRELPFRQLPDDPLAIFPQADEQEAEEEVDGEEEELEGVNSKRLQTTFNVTTDEPVITAANTVEKLPAVTAAQGRPQSNRQGTINVGFVERRKHWTYSYIFAVPPSPRVCQCDEGHIGNVNVVLEQNLTRLKEYDILIFVQDVGQKPLNPNMWRRMVSSAKLGNQRRVYASMEGFSKVRYLAPSGSDYKKKAFHWSMTYHSKSDFVAPYGYYRPNQEPRRQGSAVGERKDWAEGQTGLVAWMSSSKITAWKRAGWVKSLQGYIEVDLYGEGYKRCGRGTGWCKDIIKTYKFYLALESRCCDEYITAELWRSLSWGLVPIVVGAPREDYERLAPPNSFIYADDFGSAKELADYLRKLNNNDDLYNDFFEWRSQGDVILDSTERGRWLAKTNVPPQDNLYSCHRVCWVADKYAAEESSSFANTYFDPDVRWWGGSCRTCGNHDWIKEFN